MNQNQIDQNYNTVITTEDGQEFLVFADRLHNENLDHWEGWKCAAGYTYLAIDPDFNVHGSMCKNNYLGNLNTDFKILDSYTVCQQPTCIGCTADLSVSKHINTCLNG
jgi:hypothetical protein